MIPTNLVTSLEWSKKLKAAGVPQDSYFFWSHGEDDMDWKVRSIEDLERSTTIDLDDLYAAYTSGELGEMLPDGYSSWKKPYGRDGWACESGNEAEEVFGETETNARAAMLHFLITNGLVDVKELQVSK